jgi:AcrR family transcriptional regulator
VIVPTEKGQADRRLLRSKTAVLSTTLELLEETGIGGLSIDEVSARCGVAKTTIYRHWPSRAALLLDACSQLGRADFTIPDTGTLKGDLTILARDVASRFESTRSIILPSVMDAAGRDPEIAELWSAMNDKIAAPFRAVAERARRRRELTRRRVEDLVAAIVGPLAYRRWFTQEKLDERFIKKVVDNAVGKARS